MAIVWANENNNNTPWVSAVNQNQSDNQSVSSNSSTSSSIPSKKTWYETQADLPATVSSSNELSGFGTPAGGGPEGAS